VNTIDAQARRQAPAVGTASTYVAIDVAIAVMSRNRPRRAPAPGYDGPGSTPRRRPRWNGCRNRARPWLSW
jgi:hypothetical protein